MSDVYDMIEYQLQRRGITNKDVLRVMQAIPRELFIPEDDRDYAYDDSPVPIDEGQTISQPYIVALKTELLSPEKTHKVLEIGTGSGYQTAVLAELVQDVYSIERYSLLADNARKTLKDLNYINIHISNHDGHKGWKEHAPYDRIIVTCAAESIPQELINQLKIGGKMCVPLGASHDVQDLLLITKTSEEDYDIKQTIKVRFVPFI